MSSPNPTRVHLEHREFVGPGSKMLQPHKGTSGTRPSPSVSMSLPLLQPNEGASGTLRLFPVPVLRDASISRGCIWNRVERVRHVERLIASTPRGCIWNSRLRARRPRPTCFNPTRVHLEPGGGSFSEGAYVLQLHKGTSGTSTRSPTTPAPACFNPTRVHLELDHVALLVGLRDALTPQGYI